MAKVLGKVNHSLVSELAAAERRLVSQESAANGDIAFLKDVELVKSMPATANAVRSRLRRTEAALAITREMVAELRKGTGALPGL